MVNPIILIGAGAAALWLLFHKSAHQEPAPLPTPIPTPTPTVEPKGPVNGVYPDVKMTLGEAQKILICKGFLSSKTPSGKASNDGIYGPMTSQAVKDYQTKAGLSVTGFIDTATEAALSGETCPAAKADWADIGTTYGYSDAFSSSGRNYNPNPACMSAGAKDAGGNCDQSFLTAYAKGFGGGTYENFFRRGYQAAQSAPPGTPDENLSYGDVNPADIASGYGDTARKGFTEGVLRFHHDNDSGSENASVAGYRRRTISVARTRH